MSVFFRWITRLVQYSKLLSLCGEKDAAMPTSRSTVPFFPFEILHCKRQWSHLIENRSANMQGQNNNSIKSLSHPIQTTEVEMKISCLYFGHVSYSAVGVSPPFYLGQRDNLFPTAWEIFLSFCKFAKRKKKKKKDTKCLALWKKRVCWTFSHVFLSLHKFSVLHSFRGSEN